MIRHIAIRPFRSLGGLRASRVVAIALAALLACLPTSRADAVEIPAARGEPLWLGPPAPARPARVISLAPSLTDTVIALGEVGRLVGVTRYDTSLEVKDLPRVGGFLDPSPEVVLGLRPDLVLWLAAAALSRRRVLLVIGRDPLVVAGPGSYPDALLRIAGGENVATGGRPWPIYSLEKAVADDPDLVVDAAVNEPANAIQRLAAIPAVKAGRVVRLPDDRVLRPGPQLPAALAQLQSALRSELRPALRGGAPAGEPR